VSSPKQGETLQRNRRGTSHERRGTLSARLGLASIGLLAAVLAPVPVGAQQQNEILLSIDYDGLQPNGDAPFAANTDGMHTPGDDDNQNNNVVRTNDLIGYRIDWNVNEIDGSTVALTATLPEGMRWSTDPSTAFGGPTGCLDDGTTTIDTNSGRDLFCVLDAEVEGSNGVIRPIAQVGSQFDGQSLTLQAFIGSDEASAVGSNIVETFASARPKADWVKGADVLAGDPPVIVSQEPSEEIFGVTDPATGEVGRIWLYPLRLQPVGSLIGAEKMDDSQDILIFDHAYQMPPNAKLATGLVPPTISGAARTACGVYDGIGGYAVNSPGTWTCALDAAATTANGYPVVRIDISGHDTSVLPALKGSGSANTSELMVGQIAFFVPESDFPVGVAFNEDIYNGISGTADPVVLPADLDPIQVWGSAPASFDEAGVVNNYAFWNASAIPAAGSPGRSFRHTVHYTEGPYQEASKTTPDGRVYRSVDERIASRGGLGRVVTNTINATSGFGWGHGITGPMSQLTPRGNELVITAELDHVQAAPAENYFYEASSLCVAIDPTHQSIMALPAQFDVNHIEATSHPYVWSTAFHDSTTQEGPNTGPLAQVHIGAHPNFPFHVYSYLHAVETTLIDIPYVLEFAAATTPMDNDTGMHEVTCNNADADTRGWIAADGDLSAFDSSTPGDGVYEDITNVRLRVTGPMSWRGSEPNPVGRASFAAYGTSINLNIQVRVKDDPLVNEADMELFAYASRAYTPSPVPHAPEDVVIWDPATMANPGTPTCTNTTGGLWNNHFGDGVDHNTVVPTGWCNLPFEDDGADSNDLTDNPHDFGGGGENAYELQGNSNASYTGRYPRLVHADKVTIVEAELSIGKTNLEGPNDVNTNGDIIEFEVRPGIVGSSLDTISDVIMTDTLPAQYEFIGFTQDPATTTNTSAVVGNTVDGTPLGSPVCDVAGQVITCDFGTQVGGWNDIIRYEVRVQNSTANATYTNTARISGNDALAGTPKTPKSATARSFTPAPFDESAIIKFVDPHVGPCDLAEDCSIITPEGSIRFALDVANQGGSDLENYRIIDILPHLGDEVELASETLTGDGRTPESAFNGEVNFLSATAAGTTFLYTSDDPNTISRDPDVSETVNTWCDAVTGGAAIIGSGACPTDATTVTAVRADLGTLDAGQTRRITLDVATLGNECGDVYTNNFGGRTDNILLPIRSNDVTSTVGFCDPSIDIEKSTDDVDADTPTGPQIVTGDPVTWTYVVVNDGDVALADATVTDSDPAVTVDCDVDGDGVVDGTNVIPVLLPGGEVTCEGTGVAQAGQYSNDSSVTGTPVLPDFTDPAVDPNDPATWPTDAAAYSEPTDVVTGEPSLEEQTAEDPSHYIGVDLEPAIDIEKYTNGAQSDVAPGETLVAGQAVTWTYLVTNTGTAALLDATVTDVDSNGASVAVDCDIDSDGVFDGTNVIALLAPSSTATCQSTGTAGPGPYSNNASVSGIAALATESCVCDPTDASTWPTDPAAYAAYVDPVTGEMTTVSDEDPSNYTGATPAIDIEKDTNGVQSDTAPGETLTPGEVVTWTYVVTNTGATALLDATVADSDPSVSVDCGGSDTIAFLAVGESVTCTATGVAGTSAYMNTATVSGDPALPDFSDPAVDPADPATWPTDPAAYTVPNGPDGGPVAPVTDADDSHYTVADPQATIGGTLWTDTNADGVQAAGEAVVAGVTVELLDENGQPVLDADGNPIVAITDAEGNYLFDVEPGNYRLRMTAPDGTVFTPGNGGDDDVSNDGITAVVTVAAGENVRGVDAGLVVAPETLAATGGSVREPVAAGLVMILLGAIAVFAVRRRSPAILVH